MPNNRMADAGKTDFQREPCGIIRIAALCDLCRYRHKGHASGAAHRLDRDFSAKWTRHALAMEEATAELTASFLLADLGIAHEPRPDHAAYIASWLKLCSPRHNSSNREVVIM